MKKLLIAAFVLLVLVQWFVPGKVVWDKNTVLKKGKSFRFETMPVDPSDPFRGRYITLRFKIEEFTTDRTLDHRSYEDIYVLLDNDEQGFARVKDVSSVKPTGGQDFIKTPAYISGGYGDTVTIRIEYRFGKFYLQEFKAPKAERDFLNAVNDSAKKTYALVKVYKGDAVIENVYVNDQPLVQ